VVVVGRNDSLQVGLHWQPGRIKADNINIKLDMMRKHQPRQTVLVPSQVTSTILVVLPSRLALTTEWPPLLAGAASGEVVVVLAP
jgi:hypothetical protein